MAFDRYRVREGIVVRRTPLPSGDVVVTLLSVDGKWRAVVRKSRLPGGNPGRLSLFHDVTVQAYQRRENDLAVVAQVRLNGALARLADPAVYPYAHLLAELADRLTVDVHLGEPLHAWLASGLRGLDVDPDPERVALVHAWMLLRVAGLGPDVSALDPQERDPRALDTQAVGAERTMGTDRFSGDGPDGGASDDDGPDDHVPDDHVPDDHVPDHHGTNHDGPNDDGTDGDGTSGARLDVAGGRLARSGEGLALDADAVREFRLLVGGRAREALRDPFVARATQWRLLARYVAWHVDELRSLSALAGARPGGRTPSETVETPS